MLLTPALPRYEQEEHDPTGGDDEEREREAERLDGGVPGLHPSPAAALQHAEDHQREPEAREDRADGVELWLPAFARCLVHAADEQEDDRADHDLADEHDPPAQVGGRPAADQRADRDADSGHRTDEPVGDGALAALEVPGDERDERRHHQRRTDALEHGPPEGE